MPGPPASDATAGSDILDVTPTDIADRAAAVGEERLDRGSRDIALTGLIGGVEVSLGGVATMAVFGSLTSAFPQLGLYGGLAVAGLIFPIGFVFVILGRSELFTENFLIPVVALRNGERTLGSLAVLWGLSWLGNIAGCAGIAWLLQVPDAIGAPILDGYARYTDYKLSLPWIGVFVSAVLAGMTMTVLTWLLLAVRHPIGKLAVIAAAGYLLFATNFSHAIAGAAFIFAGYSHTHHSITDAVWWVGVATAGNLIGGVGLVTVFRVVQVKVGRD